MVGVIGERAAFERVFRAHHLAVYRYVVRRVESAAVQDVVAETFLIAWRRFDEVVGEPLPWLLGIARRVCANHLRGRERQASLRARLASEPQPPGRFATAAGDGVLLSALSVLRAVEREALLLVAWEGLSNRDAASVAGCSAGAFAVRLHRARRRLARALNAQPVDRSTINDGEEGVVMHDVS